MATKTIDTLTGFIGGVWIIDPRSYECVKGADVFADYRYWINTGGAPGHVPLNRFELYAELERRGARRRPRKGGTAVFTGILRERF